MCPVALVGQLELRQPYVALWVLWQADKAELGCSKTEMSQDMWLQGCLGDLAGQGWGKFFPRWPRLHCGSLLGHTAHWNAPVHAVLGEGNTNNCAFSIFDSGEFP